MSDVEFILSAEADPAWHEGPYVGISLPVKAYVVIDALAASQWKGTLEQHRWSGDKVWLIEFEIVNVIENVTLHELVHRFSGSHSEPRINRAVRALMRNQDRFFS